MVNVRNKKDSRVVDKYGIEDYYYYYRTNKSGTHDLPMFRKVIKLFFKYLIQDYLLKGIMVRFPGILGTFYIMRFKPTIKMVNETTPYITGSKSVDWKATLEMRKKMTKSEAKGRFIFHENPHSDGYQFKLQRTRGRRHLANTLYNFSPGSTIRDSMSEHFFKNSYSLFLNQ